MSPRKPPKKLYAAWCANDGRFISTGSSKARAEGEARKERSALMGAGARLEGQKFARLTVVRRSGSRLGRPLWECVCECGKIVFAGTCHLRSGNTGSCGCLVRDRLRERAKHGGSAGGKWSPTYVSFHGMFARCDRPSSPGFARYGARGITICKRWRGPSGFQNFLADMGPRPDGKTLDRLDVNGNYEPSNCRWATRVEQQRNTSKNRHLTVGVVTATLAEWSERTGIAPGTIQTRLERGWSPRDAVTKPVSTNGWEKRRAS